MRSDTITMEREIADLQTESAEAAATNARERSQLEARITFLTKQIVMGMNTSRPSITISCDDPAISFNLMAEKARLWDALAAAVARKNGHDWAIYHGIGTPVVIYMRGTGEIVHGATLAEAVTKAMEAEGAR